MAPANCGMLTMRLGATGKVSRRARQRPATRFAEQKLQRRIAVSVGHDTSSKRAGRLTWEASAVSRLESAWLSPGRRCDASRNLRAVSGDPGKTTSYAHYPRVKLYVGLAER